MSVFSAASSRRERLRGIRTLALLGLGLALVCASACAPSATDRYPARNILVISLCSVRADHTSLHGYRRATTPALAAFSHDAWVFSHAVTQWPKTVPAFATLMTGRYGHSNGVMRVTPGQHLDDSELTLAEVLRERGFDTAAFISSGALHAGTNIFQQGFAKVEETFRGPDNFATATALATKWIEQPRDRPFFAWVHFNNAHWPYRAPGAPSEIFVDDAWYDPTRKLRINPPEPLDLDVPLDHPYRKQIVRNEMGGIRPRAVLAERPTELAYYVARYDAGILGADRTLEPLLDAVRRLGRLDDTVVVVVADHGEALGEHDYFFEHGRFPYDDCARVPMMIRPAGGVARRVIAQPTATFSIAPTLLEMVGVAPPPQMEARSLLPMLRGDEVAPPVFSESGYQLDYTLSVRDGNWKLVFVPNPVDQSLMRGRSHELYDLAADPAELVDLAETRPEIVERLSGELRRWSRPWIRRAFTQAKDVEIGDEETRARLRSLGYLE